MVHNFVSVITRHWVSLVGAIVALVALVMIVLLIGLQLTGFDGGAYLGIITYMLLPAVSGLGLVLIPVGVWLRRRQEAAAAAHHEAAPRALPVIDLNNERTRGLLIGGLEGSMRYREGPHQYTQREMALLASSMAPTLVFDQASGELLMSGGSPGGAAIIHYTAKTLIGTLDWGLTPQQAITLPNFGSYNGPTLLERQRFPAATAAALTARGHEVIETDLTSGLQAIQRVPGGWFGGADPRREGIVMGD